MPRPARFAHADILAAARSVVARSGPAATTIQALARELGAPTGSIYHRFPSRDVILATLWLDTVERFQGDFQQAVTAEPTPSSVARFTIDWVREHPAEARIVVLYRREELTGAKVPEEVVERARKLNRKVVGVLGQLAQSWLGNASTNHLDAVRLAVVEIPYAAVRFRLSRDEPIPESVSRRVAIAATAVIEDAVIEDAVIEDAVIEETGA